ncbi:hypothetical protein D3C87_1484590 [compost metagenome]
MPQSSGAVPATISRRVLMIRSTRECSLKPSGMAVRRSPRRLRLSRLVPVSLAAVHFWLRYGFHMAARSVETLDSSASATFSPRSRESR